MKKSRSKRPVRSSSGAANGGCDRCGYYSLMLVNHKNILTQENPVQSHLHSWIDLKNQMESIFTRCTLKHSQTLSTVVINFPITHNLKNCKDASTIKQHTSHRNSICKQICSCNYEQI